MVTASFTQNQYTVSTSAGTGGSISPTSALVSHGFTTAFTIIPNTGYGIGTVSGCGGTLSGSTYTTSPITDPCTVAATFTFAANTFTVTATAGSGGMISPASALVSNGSTTTFTVTPNEGYTASVSGTCGGSLVDNTYTTNAITGPCTVAATFTLNQYTVTSTVSAAALPADAYLEIEGGSIIGGAHVVTSGGTWKIASNAGGLSVGPTNAHALRGPVSVNGVEYSGISTEALILNDDAHGDYIEFDASANHPVISFGGFLNVGAYKNYALLDVFYIDNTSGVPWLVAPQIIADSPTCAPCVQLEGAINSSTTHGTPPTWKLPITRGKTYWFSSMIDSPNRKLYLSMFDPDNYYALVGEWSITTDGQPSSSKLILRMGRQDGHTDNTHQGTTSYMDNIIIDWTNHVYPLIPNADTGGSISPISALVSHGSTTAFTVIPNTGYSIGTVSGCGGSLVSNTYTTNAITGPCTVEATFSLNQYPVTATAGPGGTISPASALVSYGSTTTFTVTPNAGYTASVGGTCGGSLVGNTYTTNAITGPCTVAATFTFNQYTVSTSAGTGGSISPTSALVSHGFTTAFTIIPDTGYGIGTVSGCGGSLSGNIYTTGPITGLCTVAATFTLNQYTVTATAGPGGSISPASALVSHGSTTTFTVTPDTGYSINTISGCGGSLAGNLYTTNAITAPCTVAADFKLGNRAPTAPTLNSPISSSETATVTPMLSVNASTDPDGDPVTYTYEVYADGGLSVLAASATTPNTSWTVPALPDNTIYYWRVLASDGILNSPWMPTASFFVNTANDAPSGPAVNSPGNNAHVASLTPVLSVTNAADPDVFDTLTYDFDVATDGGFLNVVAGVTGTAQGSGGITSWTVAPALTEDTPYYWRVRARDNHGAMSNWVSASFFVNTANSAPTAPTLNGPMDAGSVATFTPALAVNNAADADHDPLMYQFELDTVNTFDSANKQASGLTAEGSAVTTWTPSALAEDTTYYWRAKANDGIADGPWMAAASFFVNTVNAPPPAPTLNNPASGGEATVLAPTLTVNASADPDHDAVTYEYEVYSDSGLTTLVTGTTGAGTSWLVDRTLTDNTWYWWRAQARDGHGLASGWMAAGSFLVNDKGYNDPPSITITKPGASEPATGGLSYAITWTAADPDSNPAISLFYNQTGSGYSGTLIAAGMHLSDPVSSYTWNIAGLDDGTYYVYATIDDGTTVVSAYAAGPLVIDRTTASLTIAATAGPGGSITPSGAVPVASGSSQSFTITPNSGYQVQSVLVDGADQGAITSYDFQNVTASHTISASFTAITYTIIAGAGPNGTIVPSGTLSVNQGGNAAFTITPNDGYQVQNVLVDGVDQGPIMSYTFMNVAADHAISATFSLIGADTIPPTGTIAINDGAAYTTSRNVNLTLSCTDNVGCYQMQFSNDSATWSTAVNYAATRSNWSLTSGNGTKTVYARYRDAAGNWSAVSSDTIIYDSAVPVTTAAPAGGTYTTIQMVTLSCSDGTGSGCDQTYYTTDGTTPATTSSIYSSPIPIMNTTTLKYFSRDRAGNHETVKTQTYTVDTIPPAGTIAINGGVEDYTRSRTVTLNLSCTDNVACTQMQFSNDNTTWSRTATYATSKSWSLTTGNGQKIVYVKYRDAVGNWSPVYSDTIIFDDTAPTAGTMSANASPGTIALSWSGFSDAVSGLSKYTLVYGTKSTPSTCTAGTALYSGPETSYNHSGVVSGTTYYYRLCATDMAGNVSKGVTRSVVAP
jgi:hypothetical protein